VDVRYKMELDNIETIKRVVEIGTGCALLPEPAIRQEVKARSIVAVQIRDETFLRPLGIICRLGQHLSPATEKFIQYLCAR
jgi:DNA-binding transcriptional LysR family regulator